MFQELQNLKQLVEESLKAATQQQTDDNSDPFAMQQSTNLQSLARAAQRLHVTASSTAGTRYGSNWGGQRGWRVGERLLSDMDRKLAQRARSSPNFWIC